MALSQEGVKFSDFVKGLNAATESDLAAGNNMPIVPASSVKKMGGENVGKAGKLEEVSISVDDVSDSFSKISNTSYSKNLVDKNKCTLDVRLRHTTGEEYPASGSCVTDFVEIDCEKVYGIYQISYGNIIIPGCFACFFTENKKFISYVEISAKTSGEMYAVLNANIPSNTKYVRIECYYNFSSSVMLIEGEEVPSSYIAYEKFVEVKESAIPDSIARIDDISGELPQYEKTNYMIFVDSTSGGKYDSNGNIVSNQYWKYTGMTELDSRFPMYSPAADGNVVFYDADKNFISTITLKYGTPILVESYPSGAKFVAFSYQTSYSQSKTSMYVSRFNNYLSKLRAFAPTIKKKVNERPVVNIYTTDSEDDIFAKLANAVLTGDCDVFWEHGNYNFSEVFVHFYENFGARNYLELPIGGGCRYFFNGSTIKGDRNAVGAKGYSGTVDLFSCIDSPVENKSYELYDGYLIGDGLVYVVHDEGSSNKPYYRHFYDNVRMKYITGTSTSNLRKCIGGGTGLNCEVEIRNCFFETDYLLDISFHGCSTSSTEPAEFILRIENCYLSKKVQLDNLSENQKAHVDYFGNCATQNLVTSGTIGTVGSWSITAWNNSIHE